MEEKEVSSFHSLRPEVTTASFNVESKNGKLFYFFPSLDLLEELQMLWLAPQKNNTYLETSKRMKVVFFLFSSNKEGEFRLFFSSFLVGTSSLCGIHLLSTETFKRFGSKAFLFK